MGSIQDAKEYIEWISETVRLDAIANSTKRRNVYRGEVYWCWFGINIGSEQNKKRPCVILQNDKGNLGSPNTIVAPITNTGSTLDVVVPVADKYDTNNTRILSGYVQLGNVVTISKSRLDNKITKLSKSEMGLVDIALSKAIDLNHRFDKYENTIADKNQYIDKLKLMIAEKDKEIQALVSQMNSNVDVDTQ